MGIQNPNIRQVLAVAVILLFIGVAIAPTIHADIRKASLVPVPDLDCEGDLYWTDAEPGVTAAGTFVVGNIGDTESELDWEIESYPDWGTWTFDPESGTGLLPGTPVTVDVEVAAPDEPDTEFTGEVKIVNSEDQDDFCIIPASLVTPVSQYSTSSQTLFYQSYIEKLMFIIGA